MARATRSFARELGLELRTTPLESPQSNGMAEAFVRTIKRDDARVSSCPDAQSVMVALPSWFAHYDQLHPHRALGYRSPREFIAQRQTKEAMSALFWATTPADAKASGHLRGLMGVNGRRIFRSCGPSIFPS